MPDKDTMRDHLDDVREELIRTRHVLQNMTDTAHRLHREAEEHKVANEELRLKLAIAQAEVDGYLMRHDRDRREIVALGERLGAMCAIQGDLMRQLEELRDADEIERLRTDCDRWRALADSLNEVCTRIIPHALLESDRHAIADYERAVRGE